MNHRERVAAILNYQAYDRMPVVHFGYWLETLAKWVQEGHLTREEVDGWGDGNHVDQRLNEKLGWDFDWFCTFRPNSFLDPAFEYTVLEVLPDGSQKVLSLEGVVLLEKPGTPSIPSEIDHTLKTRRDWEDHYLPRLQWNVSRVRASQVLMEGKAIPYDAGGRDYLARNERTHHYGLFAGSLFGYVRNILGVTGASYVYAEDPDLFKEIIDGIAELSYRNVKFVLEQGAQFDFAHFWEDICFKNGPLVIPSVFDELVGPHYKRITDLMRRHGITLVSLDCDGCIDALLSTWLENGVNVMFPIEVGTWRASIAPWREKYGAALRGVGGMNKNIFARDFAAVDEEIERLRPLMELGGYIPCPDHRIAPDAQWDNVRYYCDRMHALSR